jgi:hypothetical protein
MYIFKELDLPRSLIFYMFDDNIGSVDFIIEEIDNAVEANIFFPQGNVPENIMEEVRKSPYYAGNNDFGSTLLMFNLSDNLKDWARIHFSEMSDGDIDLR